KKKGDIPARRDRPYGKFQFRRIFAGSGASSIDAIACLVMRSAKSFSSVVAPFVSDVVNPDFSATSKLRNCPIKPLVPAADAGSPVDPLINTRSGTSG